MVVGPFIEKLGGETCLALPSRVIMVVTAYFAWPLLISQFIGKLGVSRIIILLPSGGSQSARRR
ncbi:hypothetical protein AMTR_s00100p00143770 [Amborella trichopoda]|uniref:Uncharacterized protein n=1 Tax=Amborella trichopoda TaxID=13333 RepID=W1NYJ1_AMBTC|nr:hypothetical protein AMTR_s00100p00143770 [Amborella trichopoda]